MKMIKWIAILLITLFPFSASAADYRIDATHSFVTFKIKHLGFSWMHGQFNTLSGSFSYDAAHPEKMNIQVSIDTNSVNTNHAERDKHLRNEDFLNADKFPKATFKSVRYSGSADKGTLEGVLTLHGISKTIVIDVTKVGEGKDPWGGYRAGFMGTYKMTRKDFGISKSLGPASETMVFELGIEGIRE